MVKTTKKTIKNAKESVKSVKKTTKKISKATKKSVLDTLKEKIGFTDEIYKDNWDRGMYKCTKCGNVLFTSDSKFDSGTRWPSFRKAMKGGIAMRPDDSLGMNRTEIICKKCGNHLGHVFDDGKTCGDTHPEAGKRFCVLSDALKFKSNKK